MPERTSCGSAAGACCEHATPGTTCADGWADMKAQNLQSNLREYPLPLQRLTTPPAQVWGTVAPLAVDLDFAALEAGFAAKEAAKPLGPGGGPRDGAPRPGRAPARRCLLPLQRANNVGIVLTRLKLVRNSGARRQPACRPMIAN